MIIILKHNNIDTTWRGTDLIIWHILKLFEQDAMHWRLDDMTRQGNEDMKDFKVIRTQKDTTTDTPVNTWFIYNTFKISPKYDYGFEGFSMGLHSGVKN